jgi:SSS family solute:Na+ symporter
MSWNKLHLSLALVYLAALLIVGILTGRKKRDSNQFLNATGSLPLWVCITACIAANCGSLDVIGMMALGAQYGTLAFHFYWIGAIPALVVLAFWLLAIPQFWTTSLIITAARRALWFRYACPR